MMCHSYVLLRNILIKNENHCHISCKTAFSMDLDLYLMTGFSIGLSCSRHSDSTW